jgi:hypothetical protein
MEKIIIRMKMTYYIFMGCTGGNRRGQQWNWEGTGETLG